MKNFIRNVAVYPNVDMTDIQGIHLMTALLMVHIMQSANKDFQRKSYLIH
jgi:hypothetical protein